MEQEEEVMEEQAEEEVVEDHIFEGQDSGEPPRHISPMPECNEEPGPSTSCNPNTIRAARGPGRDRRGGQPIDKLLQAVKKMTRKIDEEQDEDVAFADLLLSLFIKIEP